MNYRHGFHAGNFADVFKHVLLRALIAGLQRKEKPFLYLDTHAGRGRYDLARADRPGREPEWPGGIGRLWGRTDLPAPVAAYVEAVGDFNRHAGTGGELRYYPGSPALAFQLARFGDRFAFCEQQPDEAGALEREYADQRRVGVHREDGYTAVRAMLPPPERRALVLIDPPFEVQGEFERIGGALAEGLRRLPAGVFAVWYPLSGRAPAEEFHRILNRLPLTPTLALELRTGATAGGTGMSGCGLVVLNPPWQFDREVRPVADFLAGALAVEPGAAARIEWLVPEPRVPPTRKPHR